MILLLLLDNLNNCLNLFKIFLSNLWQESRAAILSKGTEAAALSWELAGVGTGCGLGLFLGLQQLKSSLYDALK